MATLLLGRERDSSGTPGSAPSAAAFYTACAGCWCGCTVCRRAGTERRKSRAPFANDCTSPRTTETQPPSPVELHDDLSHGVHRIDMTCAACSEHLGHVFEDGPGETGERFCINSTSLELDPR